MPESSGEEPSVLYKEAEGLATISFNRPRHLNALTREMVEKTINALLMAEKTRAVRVVVLTGKGTSFCAGEDLKEDLIPSTTAKFRRKILSYQQLTKTIRRMNKVVIAEVSGYALGGGAEIALSCDLVYASETAKFGFPEVRVAQLMTNGMFHSLPRLVGEKRAKELALIGDMVAAPEAESMGLINRSFPPQRLHAAVIETARKIVANAPLSVQMTKSLLNRAADEDFETVMDLETDAIASNYSTRDRMEGAAAFAKKRRPIYKGR